MNAMATHEGSVIAIRGSVVDIRFTEDIPPIFTILTAGGRNEIIIEERNPAEIVNATPGLAKVKGVKVWNPAFDVTPNKFITSIITEKGVHLPPYRFPG